MKELPPVEELRKYLSYDPETGFLTRVITTTRKAGTRAGTAKAGIKTRPYFKVGVCGSYYFVHRVAWKLMTGKEPPENIDHINNDSLDNRWANLREATFAQNQQNKRLQKNNRRGFKGVHWISNRAGTKNWAANIRANGRWYRLGNFYSALEAHEAVIAKRKVLHGEFARVS